MWLLSIRPHKLDTKSYKTVIGVICAKVYKMASTSPEKLLHVNSQSPIKGGLIVLVFLFF